MHHSRNNTTTISPVKAMFKRYGGGGGWRIAHAVLAVTHGKLNFYERPQRGHLSLSKWLGTLPKPILEAALGHLDNPVSVKETP